MHNKFNMTLAGGENYIARPLSTAILMLACFHADPPHEAPGWYDVYNTDYAMQIVQSQAGNVTWLIEKGLGN